MVSGALMRGYVYNLPPNFYDAGPVGCGSDCDGNFQSQNPTVIPYENWNGLEGEYATGNAPYSKGYVELNEHTTSGWRVAFGETYHGNNNPELGTAFFIAHASISKDIDPNTSLAVTIDNVFNNVNFPYLEYGLDGISAPNQPNARGFQYAGQNPCYCWGKAYTNITQANGIGPRIIRVSFHKEYGRPH